MKSSKIEPIHPGEVLMEEFLKPMGITRIRLARDIHVSAARKPPPLRQPVDVSIDRKGGHTKGLRHHHAGSLMAHSRQFLEIRKGARHLSPMTFHENT